MDAGRFALATIPQNLILWAKRPSQEDSRPVIRLSNGGNLAEGVLLWTTKGVKNAESP